MPWRLQADMLAFRGLRLRLHRIGRTHWRAGTRLRSWAPAPLHRDGDTVHAPCADDEALWIGAWLDEENNARADVRLETPADTRAAAITLPEDFQLTALVDAQGRGHPLVRTGHGPTPLRLQLHCGADHATIALQLQPPAAWAARAGRPAPDPLRGPPPLPPRLG